MTPIKKYASCPAVSPTPEQLTAEAKVSPHAEEGSPFSVTLLINNDQVVTLENWDTFVSEVEEIINEGKKTYEVRRVQLQNEERRRGRLDH